MMSSIGVLLFGQMAEVHKPSVEIAISVPALEDREDLMIAEIEMLSAIPFSDAIIMPFE